MRLALRPAAQRDLDGIFDYSLEQWGLDRTTTYLQDLHATMKWLCHFPHMGRTADHVRPGIRLFATGSHVVVYRVGQNQIDIVRILHSRMDIDRHL